jgi:tRNA dimethylallyltransferase
MTVMPNLARSVRTHQDATSYLSRIYSAARHFGIQAESFHPDLALMLHRLTTPQDVLDAYRAGFWIWKYYPNAGTTESRSELNALTDIRADTLAMMEALNVVLCIHGEVVPDAQPDELLRELDFIPQLSWLVEAYPALRVSVEHVSDRRMLATIFDMPSNVIATITPHHLLDIASPKKVFTAADFAHLGRIALADILARGKTPIIAGGTGFYIDTLLGRVTLSDTPRNDALRTRLSTKTAEQLFALLKKKDKRRAALMDTPSERNNKVRLIRALEIASSPHSTSSPLPKLPPLSLTWIYLAPPMDTLRKKIHARLVARMKAGMVAEARRLHKSGVPYKRMEALGLEYRYLARLLQKKITKAEFLTQLESAIYDYAKRQVTYFKRNEDIRHGDR